MEEPNEPSMSDSVKLGIMIHRMGVLETGLLGIGEKIDNMGNLYPTMMHIELLFSPFREKIQKLEEKQEERVREQTKQVAQFKLAMALAFASPIISVIVTLVLDNNK